MSRLEQSIPLPRAAHASDMGQWLTALAAIGVGLIVLIGLFWDAVVKAVTVWSNTSAYNHSFLIIPIALYLIWDRRAALGRHRPAPAWRWAVLGVPFAVLWLLGNVAAVNAVQQLAFVGLVQVLLLCQLGWPVYRRLLFPFSYLWLLVPTGTFLLWPLQVMAAWFTTFALRLSEVPVFLDGVILQTPTGFYRVAPGCAGLNFLLTSLAFSLLFANLLYRSTAKRLIAIAVALIVAVVANWLRIYAIILIDYLTDRQTDIVDDHLLYGWGFFAVIMVLMIWIGLRFRDDAPGAAAPGAAGPAAAPRRLVTVSAVLAVLLVAGTGRLYGAYADRTEPAPALTLSWPASQGPWQQVPADPGWQPYFPDADQAVRVDYQAPAGRISVFVAYYWRQTSGREAVGQGNRPVRANAAWQVEQGGRRAATIDGRAGQVTLTDLQAQQRNLRVWSWYWVGGRFTDSPVLAKLLQAKVRLGFGEKRAAAVLFATEVVADRAAADALLQRALEDLAPLAAILTAAGEP